MFVQFEDRIHRIRGCAACVAAGLILLILSGMRPACAQSFAWKLRGPQTVHTNEVFEVRTELHSIDVPPEQGGVEGWQLGVAHENLQILSVSLLDTVVEPFIQTGFASIEITSGRDNEGFVSGVVLSFDSEPTTLPPEGAAVVARARYRVPRVACFDGATVRVADGLRATGDPIANRVSQNGSAHTPLADRLEFDGCEPNRYTLSLFPSRNPLVARWGETVLFDINVRLEQQAPTASGWELAVAHVPVGVTLQSVSIDGTGLESWLADDGFVLFEATSGPSNAGFVATAELSSLEPTTLLPTEQIIARATFALSPIEDLPEDLDLFEARLATSLRGSGGAVENRVFPEGILALQSALRVPVQRAALDPYRRGDANADGNVDIADTILVLSFIFLGASVRCMEAADVDRSLEIDISDPIRLLGYLFLGKEPPAPPFPGCGRVPLSFDCESSRCP